MHRPGYHPVPIHTRKVALRGAIRRKSIHRSLLYWIDWLEQAPHEPGMRLRRAIRASDIPAHLLHHFACDCVERIVSCSQHTSHAFPTLIWQTIANKRLWIEGQITWDTFLFQARSAQELLHELRHTHPRPLLKTVRSLFLEEATLAAHYSTETTHIPFDQRWQTERLVALLQEYNHALHHLVGLLHLRYQTLAPQVQQLRVTLEDALFQP